MQKSFRFKLVEDIVELRTFHPNDFNIYLSALGSRCLNLYGFKIKKYNVLGVNGCNGTYPASPLTYTHKRYTVAQILIAFIYYMRMLYIRMRNTFIVNIFKW